ncbi:MAG: CoA transferase, partial [Dehalococcoidia bacterium]
QAAAAAGLPLEGVKVLDFMWVVAGPWSTRYLADYGATVIKVESPNHVDTSRTIGPTKDHLPGPERSALFCTVNAGKHGISLNLGTDAGRDVVMRLVKWADVITDSFAAGAMGRFGLGYEAVKAVNPGVIMLSSCLNGQSGPHASLAGFGTMGLHLAGFGDIVGWADRPPAGAAGAYTDYIAPKFTASVLLAALDHRRRTGEGQYIDFSQAEAAAHFLAPALLDYFVNGVTQTRRGNRSATHAPHGIYPAAGDDRWVAIVCTSEGQWNALAVAAERREWLTDPRFATREARVTNGDALDQVIGAWSAQLSVDDLESRLQASGVPCHRVTTTFDVLADPQLAHRGHFITVDHPEVGSVPIESSRLRLSRTPARVPSAAPTMGQHNEFVLRDILGLSDDQVVEVVAGGALE